jgi:hypothetical protein
MRRLYRAMRCAIFLSTVGLIIAAFYFSWVYLTHMGMGPAGLIGLLAVFGVMGGVTLFVLSALWKRARNSN